MAGAVTAENPVKTMMRAGRVALGMNVRLARSGDIARIAKSSGHDFIFIDTQHSLFNLETIGHIAQAALGCGIAPLVRVRSCDDPDVPVLLDNGVTGIVFPDISTAEQARRAVDRARFPPVGRRSVVGGYAIFDYRTVPVSEAAAAIDRVLTATLRHGKIAGVGGDRHLPRQMEYIRRGARFITTNSEIAFIMAEASRVTGELRQALRSGSADLSK